MHHAYTIYLFKITPISNQRRKSAMMWSDVRLQNHVKISLKLNTAERWQREATTRAAGFQRKTDQGSSYLAGLRMFLQQNISLKNENIGPLSPVVHDKRENNNRFYLRIRIVRNSTQSKQNPSRTVTFSRNIFVSVIFFLNSPERSFGTIKTTTAVTECLEYHFTMMYIVALGNLRTL